MKKTSSIVKLSIIGVIIILGFVLSFCSVNLPGNTKYNSFTSAIKLGLDLKGGIYAVYEATDSDTGNFDTRMDGTRTRLENLIVDKGYSEATVVREGTNRLRVEVPDVDSPDKIFQIIGKPAQVRFELVDSQDSESGSLVITGKEHVTKASAGYYQSEPVVELQLNSEGSKKFSEATSNTGKYIAIKVSVEGEEPRIISAPKIEEQITGGKAIINGMANYEEAKNLADQIMSGTFDVTLSLMESATVSATLGDQALFLGLIAGIVGVLLVMIFLCFIYRTFGGVASISLMIYAILMFFFLAVLPWVQLTLPGIAGIILSLGMAVDANVVIYERIKYEYRNGKSIMAASNAGFKRATIAIVDSNVTTIIAAVLLLIFGTGSIRGFALTLLIGIILSLFTSLVVTRKLVKYAVAINSTNPKLYNLKRGKGFEDISADQTDSAVQEKMDAEQRERDAKKKVKKDKKKQKGEIINENA